MRTLVVTEPGSVSWRQAPDPHPEPDGAVLRPLAVARCDLDWPMATRRLFPFPLAAGHEAVGEIVAVGEEVTGRRVGERVIVPFQVSCGACASCGRRHYAACDRHRAQIGGSFGFGAAGGGYPGAVADLLAVPHADHLLVPAPDDLPNQHACLLADNVVDGWRAVAPALAAEPGADVLVVGGQGPFLALSAILAAQVLDAATITYVDHHPGRLADAVALGADVVDVSGGWPTTLPRATVVVENSGSTQGLQAALTATAPYGHCTSVAIHFDGPAAFPLLQLYTRGITYHTSRADVRRLLGEVLAVVGSGALDLGRLPTAVASFDDAPEAWLAASGKLVLRREM